MNKTGKCLILQIRELSDNNGVDDDSLHVAHSACDVLFSLRRINAINPVLHRSKPSQISQESNNNSIISLYNKNSPFQDYKTRNARHTFRECHLNIEGISKSKYDVLSKIVEKNLIKILALQETYTTDEEDLRKRGYISDFQIVEAINSRTYGQQYT